MTRKFKRRDRVRIKTIPRKVGTVVSYNPHATLCYKVQFPNKSTGFFKCGELELVPENE